MLDPHLYLLFLTAAVLLTLAPGPDTMLVLGASLSNGARGGLLASAGIMTGLLVHIALAVVGVSALIAASPLAFDVLRWAGAAYLIWIGVPLLVRAWRERRAAPASAPISARVRGSFRSRPGPQRRPLAAHRIVSECSQLAADLVFQKSGTPDRG